MMKSSTLRWSFGSIHWSGLKVPSLPSPRGTRQATLLGMSETSKTSITRAPLLPSRTRCQVVSTPQPSGDTMPRPVTTTRLMSDSPKQGPKRPSARTRPQRAQVIWARLPGKREGSWIMPQQPTARNRSTAIATGRFPQYHVLRSALGVLLEEFRRVADRQDRLRGVIGNFAAELFFESHHQLDRVEAVSTEVIDEARIVDHLLRLNTKMLDHDLLNPLANLTHR